MQSSINAHNLRKKSTLVAIAIVLPVLAVVFALVQFQKNSKAEISTITNKIGDVAGAKIDNQVVELSTKDLPIFPEADIVSIDSRNTSIFILLEIRRPDSEIISFYNDYLFQNGWIQDTDNKSKYVKENKILELSISEGIINLTITQIEKN